MSKAVVWLDQARQTVDRELIGSKAHGLLALTRMGLTVPRAFCVTTPQCRAHLDALNIDTRRMRTGGSLLAEIRETITRSALDEKLDRAIRDAVEDLGDWPLAVRSSAIAEDLPGHSFAGQYDTELGVVGADACIETVKRCWASLWTERAVAYRESNGFAHDAMSMAVVVQRLVPAEVSGVVFTANPLNGSKDSAVLEACYGLGEGLVSGKVTPDRFVFDRASEEIMERSCGAKATAFVPDANGAVREVDVEPSRAECLCLDDETISSILEKALGAESVFGVPQDVEFAVAGGDILFLQSRPITRLSSEKTWAQKQLWTNANAGEVLPGVVTPLTWALCDRIVYVMFERLFGMLGIDIGDNVFIARIAGRAYFNLNSAVAAIVAIPGVKDADLTAIFGGDQTRLEEAGEIELPEEDRPEIRFRAGSFLRQLPGFTMGALRMSPQEEAAQLVTEMNARARTMQGQDFSTVSDAALAKQIRESLGVIDEIVVGMRFMVPGMLGYAFLTKLCAKWLNEGEGYASRFLVGMGEMDSADAGLALWGLAESAGRHEAVKTAVLERTTWVAVRDSISKMEDGGAFLNAWDAFMERHGHHARGEVELAVPRWAEQPDYVLQMVQGYLTHESIETPIARRDRLAQEREGLTADTLARFRSPLKRWAFKFALTRAQRGGATRENVKSGAVRYLTALRTVCLEAGRRLTDRGILDEPSHVFFFEFDELAEALEGVEGPDYRANIQRRRDEFALYETIEPPAVISGVFNIHEYVPDDEAPVAKETMEGIAVSAGTARGPARVILLANDTDRVLPGEILVAPFTDPGWTPYFLNAAAIVMDQGGLLSHGSIVAREYGIPAVVNVGPATKTIRTGDMIEVDGDHGVVRIVDAKI